MVLVGVVVVMIAIIVSASRVAGNMSRVAPDEVVGILKVHVAGNVELPVKPGKTIDSSFLICIRYRHELSHPLALVMFQFIHFDFLRLVLVPK